MGTNRGGRRRSAPARIAAGVVISAFLAMPAGAAYGGSFRMTAPDSHVRGREVIRWTYRTGTLITSRSTVLLTLVSESGRGRTIARNVPVSRRSYSWDTTSTLDGTYVLQGRVYTPVTITRTSRSRTASGAVRTRTYRVRSVTATRLISRRPVVVDNSAPTAIITKPQAGQLIVDDRVVTTAGSDAIVAGSVTLSADAQDGVSGVDQVLWRVDGELVGEGEQVRHSFRDVRPYDVTLEVIDRSGNATETRVAVMGGPGPEEIAGVDPLPSELPEVVPSDLPDVVPSDLPEVEPSETPDPVPSELPEVVPSELPSAEPSELPDVVPSELPEVVPSETPDPVPSELPNVVPSELPSVEPSALPSVEPSKLPSVEPSKLPIPSETPSPDPSELPSPDPSEIPSVEPSELPSVEPSELPSPDPSVIPSVPPAPGQGAAPSKGPLVEQLSVPSWDSVGVTTTRSLEAGKQYIIEVSGAFNHTTYAPGYGTVADAECARVPNLEADAWLPNLYNGVGLATANTTPSDDPYDLYVNYAAVQWTPASGAACDQGGHTYRLLAEPSVTRVYSFKVFDPWIYSDNTGELTVSIYEAVAGSPAGSRAPMASALPAIALLLAVPLLRWRIGAALGARLRSAT